jgi:alanine racemase
MNILQKTTKEEEEEDPLIKVLLSRSALINNLREFQKLSPAVSPVLKSNAFGHGLAEIASILDTEKLPFFILDSHDEAMMLRSYGFRTPILIIGYTQSRTLNTSTLEDISYTVTSFESLVDLCSNAKFKLKVHLKIDTGMNRQGILPNQIDEVIALIKKSPNVILEGICSHLADADNSNTTFTDNQINIWNELVELFMSKFSTISYYHISNTPGHGHIEKAKSNMSRLGVGLYGLTGNGKVDSTTALRPVMKLVTVVSGIKLIKPNTKVGYNGKFTSTSNMRIATIPVGYGMSFDRRLSDKGCVKIGSSFVKILGRVSMNITIIDIGNIPNIKLDTPVTVISDIESDQNSIINIAKICETIPHDIATSVSPLLYREITD